MDGRADAKPHQVGESFSWAAIDPASCSIGHAVATIGDRWSLLLLREIAFGVDRFDALQRHLGISRRTLAERLSTLHAHGVVERAPVQDPGQRAHHRYQLTPSGDALRPVLQALSDWGDSHRPTDPSGSPDPGPPVTVVHAGCGAPVHLHLRCEAGHTVQDPAGPAGITPVPGPGAQPMPTTGPHPT